jgi:hypothetical protein
MSTQLPKVSLRTLRASAVPSSSLRSPRSGPVIINRIFLQRLAYAPQRRRRLDRECARSASMWS